MLGFFSKIVGIFKKSGEIFAKCGDFWEETLVGTSGDFQQIWWGFSARTFWQHWRRFSKEEGPDIVIMATTPVVKQRINYPCYNQKMFTLSDDRFEGTTKVVNVFRAFTIEHLEKEPLFQTFIFFYSE